MGLLRVAGRTAVIAGTATAVSNRVSRRQANRWSNQEEQQYAQAQEQYAQAPPPPPAGEGTTDKLDQLKQLGELHTQGVLTDAEFEAQKAKILAS